MTQDELEKRQCFSINIIKEVLGDKLTIDMKMDLVAKAIGLVDKPMPNYSYKSIDLPKPKYIGVDESAELLKDAPDPFADMTVPTKEPEVWTDETLMTYGKYKGEKLANIPEDYLRHMYDTGKAFPAFREYIIKSLNL